MVADEAGTVRRGGDVDAKGRWGEDVTAKARMAGLGTWVADETSTAEWGTYGPRMRRVCQVGLDTLPIRDERPENEQ